MKSFGGSNCRTEKCQDCWTVPLSTDIRPAVERRRNFNCFEVKLLHFGTFPRFKHSYFYVPSWIKYGFMRFANHLILFLFTFSTFYLCFWIGVVFYFKSQMWGKKTTSLLYLQFWLSVPPTGGTVGLCSFLSAAIFCPISESFLCFDFFPLK